VSGKNKNNKHNNELTAQSIFDRFTQNKSAALIAAVSTLGLVNLQAEEPAVSQLNAKVEGVGGFLDGDATGLGALSGATDGDGLVGYGAHFFWRNPEQGLLCATAARSGQRILVRHHQECFVQRALY